MQQVNRDRIVGLGLAVALLTTVAWHTSVASHSAPSSQTLKTGPITDAVVAPAEQLGAAFTMVARHVEPAVVSVYSETIAKVQTGDSPMEPGENPLWRFFQPNAYA